MHKGTWTENEMHYAYWMCFTGKRLAELMAGNAPEPEHFKLSRAEKKRVRNYLRRIIRRKRGDRPVARTARSFALDANMYSIVEKPGSDRDKKNTQFLTIMGLEPRKRLVIPLTGYSHFAGNIRIVLDFQKQRVEVHTINEMIEEYFQGETIALDAGISEVFTDEKGNQYEPAFGKTLGVISTQLNKTGKARNKAHALRKTSSKHKAHRIRKYNLGKQKKQKRTRKARERIRQQISCAIRQVVKTRKPGLIVTENLDIRGKSKSKELSRRVTIWMRSSLKERLGFLALVEGFHQQQVNPAYTSQMCPTCLFVDKGNRAGDIFKCLNCGYSDHADRVAANNLLARRNDPEITIYTPKSVVWSILQKRFIASLETPVGGTVSGRTGVESKLHQSETPVPNPYIVNGHGTETSVYI
jgi:IS605 OrfB family transposase